MTITETPAADAPQDELAARLLSPEAIRAQCGALFALAEQGRLAHFTLHLDRLDACADEVVATILAAYPTLRIPPHARWRHFDLGGRDRWAEAAARLDVSRAERLRLETELAILSVLLDAGAGPDWRFTDEDGAVFARSEGLALASLRLFLAGGFHSAGEIGSDLKGLRAFGPTQLAAGFQVDGDNPLEGLAGRAALISELGTAVAARPDVFGAMPRLGNLADHLVAGAAGGQVAARDILCLLLDVLGPIWPDRPVLAGRSLGDCWAHPAAPGAGLVPFHKLSQWLSYSLIEPLERAGHGVRGLEALTGLAEYRNGGLFLDTGVLALRDPAEAERAHGPGAPLIVEWRALTVVLLDRVADLVRERLDRPDMPLASILEGGTWATGRRLAGALRPGGAPPLNIISTGTVF